MCQDQQAELRFLKSKVENVDGRGELESLLPHSRSGSKSSSGQGELEIVRSKILGIQETLSTVMGDNSRGDAGGRDPFISMRCLFL